MPQGKKCISALLLTPHPLRSPPHPITRSKIPIPTFVGGLHVVSKTPTRPCQCTPYPLEPPFSTLFSFFFFCPFFLSRAFSHFPSLCIRTKGRTTCQGAPQNTSSLKITSASCCVFQFFFLNSSPPLERGGTHPRGLLFFPVVGVVGFCLSGRCATLVWVFPGGRVGFFLFPPLSPFSPAGERGGGPAALAAGGCSPQEPANPESLSVAHTAGAPCPPPPYATPHLGGFPFWEHCFGKPR